MASIVGIGESIFVPPAAADGEGDGGDTSGSLPLLGAASALASAKTASSVDSSRDENRANADSSISRFMMNFLYNMMCLQAVDGIMSLKKIPSSSRRAAMAISRPSKFVFVGVGVRVKKGDEWCRYVMLLFASLVGAIGCFPVFGNEGLLGEYRRSMKEENSV